MRSDSVNKEQFDIMKDKDGFIAALDQSGGSTPRALKAYGIAEDSYSGEDEMFDLVHEMRSRIITSKSFTEEKILAAILFEQTMDRKIQGKYSGDFLWEEKGIVPLLKVDQGLDEVKNDVQLMKPLTKLDALLERANERKIFGTKMRSVIKEANEEGIIEIVDQQFEVGKKIYDAGLIPILEPEVDINSSTKEEAEEIMKREIMKHLDQLEGDYEVIFKLTIPSKDDFFKEIIEHPRTIRVVALSGGYTREAANEKLERNPKLIASFSRGLTEGLSVEQNDQEFDDFLEKSIDDIYQASIK